MSANLEVVMRLVPLMAMIGLALATSAIPSGAAGSPGPVQCCLKLAIEGVTDPPRCLKVNFNVTPRRLARHPKRACRMLGGTPATTAACVCG